MAKVKLNVGGKVLLVVVGLAIIVVVLYKYGVLAPVLSVVAPEKPQEGTVDKNLFTSTAGTQPATPQPPSQPQAAPATPQGPSGSLNRPIKVAIVTWGGYAGGLVANNGLAPSEDSLFFKKHGIKVEIKVIDDFVQSRSAFKIGGDKDGGVDIMWGTVDSFALEYDSLKDLRPKTIMQYDWSRGGDAIAVDGSITEVAHLKGKSLAVAEGTPSHYFALYVLTNGGLTNKDVRWVFTNSAVEAAAAFKAGKVDGCVSWSPDVYEAAKSRTGGRILASTKEATNLIADIFIARGDFLDRYPDEVTKFIWAWLQGVEEAKAAPLKAQQIMTKSFSGVDMAAAKGMWEDVKLPDYLESRQFFEMDGDIPRGYDDIYREANGIWRTVGKISDRTPALQTRETKFLDALKSKFAKKAEVEAQPEFVFTEKPKAQKTSILTKRISIYFQTGSSTLDENAKYALEQIAELATTFGNAYMRISGNTDNVGNKRPNQTLSEKRARAVADYLITKYNFPANKFEVFGNGPDKPIASNDSEEGRAKNRRTDFEIIPR